jgi:hypothetical protein
LGVWEHLNNPAFKPAEFDGFKKKAGLNSFTLTPKQWIEKTNAIGLISKAGRYGGSYGHKDIAFEFASWIPVEFKLYLMKEFQRLKDKGDAEIAEPMIGKRFVVGNIFIAHAMVCRWFRTSDFPHDNYSLSGSGIELRTMLTSRTRRVAL